MIRSPGSTSAYALAGRDMFKGQPGPAPTDYSVKVDSIIARNETVAPFDTSAIRNQDIKSDGPGPIYFPVTKDRRQYGSLPFRWGSRLPEKPFDPCSTTSEPVWGRIPDPWVQMTEKILNSNSMRPRVQFEKYVSNCVPSVYHPLDIRCFIMGIDGRPYPWKMNRDKTAGPNNYNTYQVYTSQSKMTPKINFGAMSKRKDLFPPQVGAGPAGYKVRPGRGPDGGVFLGKKFDDPNSSALRLFDILQRRTIRYNFASSTDCTIPSGFEKYSPKAVSAPFKSKTALGGINVAEGPGPAAYFKVEMQESDLKPRLKPGLTTFPPEKILFDISEERFTNPEIYELMDRPSPADYDILGFTDIMKRDLERHSAAIPNPKLGFLSSAEARPSKKDKDMGDINIVTELSCHCLCEKPRKWRNLRPKTGITYGYFGPPSKYPDTPGPIYDTAPGTASTKGKKSWWDPRRASNRTAFNSGCMRKTGFYIDMDVPSPGKYFSRLPRCCRELGTQSVPGPRFKELESVGPGPTHKLHDKCDSVWRASHLGTHNAYLKQVGVLFPWAGGFRKRNLTQAGDEAWHITRDDDYAEALCPKNLEQAK